MDIRTGVVEDYIPVVRDSNMATGLRRRIRGLFYSLSLVGEVWS